MTDSTSQTLPRRKPLTAGSEIDSWCTKCRLDLGHRIVAMVSGLPKRVVCLTCGSEHNYRAPKGTAGTPTPKATRSSSSAGGGGGRVTKARAEWETRTAGKDAAAFTRYAMDKTFTVDQLVLHKKFGEGYVVEVTPPDKVTIAFRDGHKTLVYGRA